MPPPVPRGSRDRPGSVLADDLDPEAVVFRVGDEFGGLLEVVRARSTDLALDVAVACGDDDVDAVDVALEREVDVVRDPATEARDAGVQIEVGHPRDCLTLTRTGTGAAGFDDGDDAGARGSERSQLSRRAKARRPGLARRREASCREGALYGPILSSVRGVSYRQEW